MLESLEKAGRQLCFARQISFRDVCKPFVGNFPPTLSNESIALVFAVSKDKKKTQSEIAEKLPKGCQKHFNNLRRMENPEQEPFFKRFVLFAKASDDGMLVGFGIDELYYVLITFDQNGYDVWSPENI